MSRPNPHDIRDLHLVAMRGDWEYVDRFVQKFGAQYIDMPSDLVDNSGNTPLLRAILNKRHDVAKRLIDHGAALNAANAQGSTPWQQSITRGTDDLVEYMLDHGANPNAAVSLGFTAFTVAAQCGYAKIVALLLSRGAEIDKQDSKGNTALMTAAAGHWESVVILLLKKGASTRPVNKEGLDALALSPNDDSGNIYAMIAIAAAHERKTDTGEILKKPIGIRKDTEVFKKKINVRKKKRGGHDHTP